MIIIMMLTNLNIIFKFVSTIMVASNLVRGNFVRIIKFNLFHNNTVFIQLYIITY